MIVFVICLFNIFHFFSILKVFLGGRFARLPRELFQNQLQVSWNLLYFHFHSICSTFTRFARLSLSLDLVDFHFNFHFLDLLDFHKSFSGTSCRSPGIRQYNLLKDFLNTKFGHPLSFIHPRFECALKTTMKKANCVPWYLPQKNATRPCRFQNVDPFNTDGYYDTALQKLPSSRKRWPLLTGPLAIACQTVKLRTTSIP